MIETPTVSDQSLIYMYGLSDFWSDIFGDTDLVESVLATSTISMGEVYSYFLQRAAGISLTDIEERYQTRIKLLLIDETSALDEDGTTFPIDDTLESFKKLSNRPILPTQTLDNDVHYEVLDGTIRFNKPISELKFPVRYTSSGTPEYALWMVDVEINEKWIDNSFGRLVGFTEDNAIFNYKSFLEGVYYLYTNGPNISFIERGVNLAMGMPYARSTEVILDVRQDAYTGNWIVFTDTEAYELPYGYRPDLLVGDTLTENQVLTTWVEIRDYTRNGEWWYDVYLPNEVLSNTTNSSSVGKCTPGSTGDKMMKNFLKHHMFEVLITQPNGDESSFNTARDLVLYAKPEYTYPVFVWVAPIEDEIIEIEDDLDLVLQLDLQDTMISPPSIRYMDRGVHSREEDDENNPGLPREDFGHDPFIRGTHWYNRVQGSMYSATLIGYGDWPGNAGWAPEFSGVTKQYKSYLDQLFRTRGDLISPHSRGTVNRGWRGHAQNLNDQGEPSLDTLYGLDWNVQGSDVLPVQASEFIVNERDLTPLYMLTNSELVDKMRTINPRFKLSEDKFKYVVRGLDLPMTYDTWMVRNQQVLSSIEDGDEYDFVDTMGGLDIKFSIFANQSYVPKRSDMFDDSGNPISDGEIFISRTTRDVWAVQWVRKSVSNAPTLFPIEDQDHLQAIEVYDQTSLGEEKVHGDKPLSKGQQSFNSPVVLGVEGYSLVTEEGLYVPSYKYDVGEDRVTVSMNSPMESAGNVSFVPYLGEERILAANGSTYLIPETILAKEELFLSYSPTSSDYEFIVDYEVSPDPSAGTIITLDTSLPVGGDLIVTYVSKGNAPSQESFSPSGSVYTIQAGYTVKILSEGRLFNDREYQVIDDQLTFSEAPISGFVVRYYPSLTYTTVSSFNRSTVQRNEARFLMDRGRAQGEYDDRWRDTPNVYINRGGSAWATPPVDDQPPEFADTVNVVRRLR